MSTKADGVACVCAVDGSVASDVAFEGALALLNKRDHLYLFHAFCPAEEDEKPQHLRSKFIKDSYESRLSSECAPSSSLMWCQKEAKASVKELLMDIVHNVSFEFLVIGYTARNGYSRTTCGSNNDFTMRNFGVTTVVVKYPIPPNEPKSFLYFVKRTALGRLGLDKLFRLMSPLDNVTVVFIDDGSDGHFDDYQVDAMREYYESRLKENSSAVSSFRVVESVGFNDVRQAIIDTVNDVDPVFCCIAPREKEYKGSITERLILEVKPSLILLK